MGTDIDEVEKIAIVGLACRFPGAGTAEQFWHNLREGVESIRFFDRDELLTHGIPNSFLDHPNYVAANGVLDQIDLFDADFFDMTPREAEITDPQHRLFLECAWQALEHAGHEWHNPDALVGVYAGAGLSHYLLNNLMSRRDELPVSDFQLLMGNNKDFVPTRVSYKLNLKGPSVNVNTACSTSLVAVHMACQSLLDYECDVALAGGVGIQVPQEHGYLYEEGSVVSPDGHCRPFDIEAQGTVNGSGAGAVVLKRLEDAIADGNTIHAVILSSAINNDGADKVGFTAPSVNGQAKVIAEALAKAEVSAETINYIEAHGTATVLGDPIEVAALTQVFREYTDKTQFCALGSVKSNVGHLDEAAGVAGLIKTVLALRHKTLPPSLHYTAPNPRLKLERSPFYVNGTLQPWQRNGSPRRAGISSFGIGGTNAHIIVEEYEHAVSSDPTDEAQILLLSAKSAAALASAVTNLSDHLKTDSTHPLADIAYTLAQGRQAFSHRRAVVANTPSDAIAALQAPSKVSPPVTQEPPKIVFMFSGQGSQYAGMAEALYGAEPVFRESLDHCFGTLGMGVVSAEKLAQTQYTQPLLFAVEYALAQLWMSWGVQPAALIGHSLGEYVAACLAGVFSLEDALQLVSLRGQLMQQCPRGAMAAVRCDETFIQPYLTTDVSLAALNAPDQCVVSGTKAAVTDLIEQLEKESILCHLLATEHAFHSALMDAALTPFTQTVAQKTCHAPQIPIISNVSGGWLTAEQASDPAYWAQHIRQTVRFADGINLLAADHTHFIEVGVGTTLEKLARRITEGKTIVSSLPREKGSGTDVAVVRDALGTLWTTGVDVDWTTFYQGQTRRRVPLPTYPFQRQRHWVELLQSEAPSPPTHPISPPAVDADVTEWFYRLTWTESPLSHVLETSVNEWLILSQETSFTQDLVAHLRQQGDEATLFSGDDYKTLLDTFSSAPTHIIHVAQNAPDATLENGFFTLLHLTQALDARGWAEHLTLSVLTQNGQAVAPADVVEPNHATIGGALRVIPLEYPSLVCRQIDYDQPLGMSALYIELTTGSDPSIAYRNGQRLTPALEAYALAEKQPTLDADGVYLVTGGKGSMGRAFSDYLLENGAGTVVSFGRSPHTTTRHNAPYIQVDVSNQQAMDRALTDIRAQYGTIRGVVHTAGVLGQGLIRHKVDADVQAVFAPKIAGTDNLGGLLRDDPLDFFLLCGSMSAIIPIAGQIDYSAANAYMDGAAHELRRAGIPALCVDWGFWQELGLIEVAKMPLDHKAAILEDIAENGRSQAGVAAFARLLAHIETAPTQLIVYPDKLQHPVTHPLFLHYEVEGETVTYTSRLNTSQHWVIDEHRLGGAPILPGTGHLQFVHAAFCDYTNESSACLSEVYFLAPLIVTVGVSHETKVIFQPNDEAYTFQVISREGEQDAWLEHVRGVIAPLSPDDAEGVRFETEQTLQASEIDASMVPFGPRWHCFDAVAFGDGVGVADLSLSAEFHPDLTQYPLHPALLDMATGFLTLQSGIEGSLPFSYEKIIVHHPLTAQLVSSARLRGTPTANMVAFDVTICDPEGRVLVTIENYRLRGMVKHDESGNEAEDSAENFNVAINTQGMLDTLTFNPVPRRAPAPDDVEIEVVAAGLNFIEVLYALGMLPKTNNARFGIECAGRIVRVGSNVTDFAPGDGVFAYSRAAFSRYTTVPARQVAPKPDHLTFVEAATIPTTFTTAYYGLVTQGRLAAREKILIHSASGGVGLAAIQIAQTIGAEIFATAGLPEKREFVRSLGIDHVMNSRSLDFADEIQAVTPSVDLILNSLGGDFINKNLELLAPYGRLVELGKRDLFKNTPLDMHHFTRSLSFLVIDVGPSMPQFTEVWEAITEQLHAGTYEPLPQHVFPISQLQDAISFMAQAKHIGKVILTIDEALSLQTARPATRTLDAILGKETVKIATPPPVQPYQNGQSETALQHGATTETEAGILAIWRQLLGVEQIGIDDDFFDLKGDSLLAAQVISHIHKKLGHKLPLSALFDTPTIAGLAQLIDKDKTPVASDDAIEFEMEEGEI